MLLIVTIIPMKRSNTKKNHFILNAKINASAASMIACRTNYQALNKIIKLKTIE